MKLRPKFFASGDYNALDWLGGTYQTGGADEIFLPESHSWLVGHVATRKSCDSGGYYPGFLGWRFSRGP